MEPACTAASARASSARTATTPTRSSTPRGSTARRTRNGRPIVPKMGVDPDFAHRRERHAVRDRQPPRSGLDDAEADHVARGERVPQVPPHGRRPVGRQLPDAPRRHRHARGPASPPPTCNKPENKYWMPPDHRSTTDADVDGAREFKKALEFIQTCGATRRDPACDLEGRPETLGATTSGRQAAQPGHPPDDELARPTIPPTSRSGTSSRPRATTSTSIPSLLGAAADKAAAVATAQGASARRPEACEQKRSRAACAALGSGYRPVLVGRFLPRVRRGGAYDLQRVPYAG